MPRGHGSSASTELNRLLASMNQEGEFPISVLADAQGLAIASAADGEMNADRQSAVGALIQQTALRASRQLGMGTADELCLFDEQGQRLVCRPFQIGEYSLVLALMVPGRDQSYRRLTTQTIAEIRRVWAQHWE